jgi:hypothetical protein
MVEFAPILVPALSFAAVASLVFLLGRHWAIQIDTQRRLPLAAEPHGGAHTILPVVIKLLKVAEVHARRLITLCLLANKPTLSWLGLPFRARGDMLAITGGVASRTRRRLRRVKRVLGWLCGAQG